MPIWRVIQLADSAFPTGGFAHSAGLEAAVQLGEVTDAAALRRFVAEALWQAGYGGLPLVRAAYEEPRHLIHLDRLCDAFLTGFVANRASRTQGAAFIATCARVFGASPLAEAHAAVRARRLHGHYAPLFGAAFRALEVPLVDAQQLFLHFTLRAVTSAAVRLGAIGPHEAQRLQDESTDQLDGVLAECAGLDVDALAQPAPLVEIIGAQHDRLYSRLFQS
jgi:urease accessory protein